MIFSQKNKLILRVTRAVAVGFFMAVFLLTFVVGLIRTSGASMSPTLQDDTVVVLFKLPHVFNCVPEYGDIVAIDPRSHRSRSVSDDFIDTFETMIHKIKGAAKSENIWGKRVIGLPGDTIEFLDGSHVFRNGIQLEEPYLLEPMNYRNMHTYVVPDNSIFVLGDNRNHSIDSRYIGFIPIDHVLGRVIKL